MKFKSSKEIRQAWIDYFVSKGHLFIESKSLIPHKDPSLLWINSGVATLKDYFSGKKTPPSKRLTNSQKSIRTNDIENVGVTARHHTFFEMLGNFSIGDYFKKEAIEFAHEVITKVFGLEQEKIYITFYEEDYEVKEKWMSLGYPESHLIPGSKKLNFWDVGSGPCGPNTEIFYDRGPKYHTKGPELIANDIENDRFIEIWNIVFSQYNNLGDNNYVELSQKNIDTGAGLERITSILQNGPTNFDTDLFLPIIKKIEKMTTFKYEIDNYFKQDPKQNIINKHFKIIADHMRAITNAISDGEKPSNTQRGYIIRKLIRRAYYSGKKLEIEDKTFLNKLVQAVVDSLIFSVNVDYVSKIIEKEELAFEKTIKQGKEILENQMKNMSINDEFSVDVAFKLYETYGFPIEMTRDILKENGLKLDMKKMDELIQNHSEKSKSNQNISNFSKQINSLTKIEKHISKFIGYDHTELKNAKILYLMNEQDFINSASKNNISYLILEETPMYATSGGQLHDQGYMIQGNNKIEVLDIFKDKNNNNVHVVKGNIDKNQPIDVFVNKEVRQGLMRNHSATHLTFAALRKIYGNQIQQLGSDNNQDRLTFDFPLEKKPTNNEIMLIEKFVRNIIDQNIKRNYLEMTTQDAKKIGAIFTIDEAEYFDSNKIRIVEFPGVTSDLCGGTHIDFTKNLEAYKIVNVESKGSGIFRIKAITSNKIVNDYLKSEINKNLEVFNSIYKKYENIYKLKETNRQFIENMFKNISEQKNYELLLNNIKEQIEIISNEIKLMLKEKNKIDEKIEIEKIEFNKIPILLINNVSKENLKDVAIQEREKSPNSLIIATSKTENNKASLIICSKTLDVMEFVKEFFSNENFKGGGNKSIWQGIVTNQINIKDFFK